MNPTEPLEMAALSSAMAVAGCVLLYAAFPSESRAQSALPAQSTEAQEGVRTQQKPFATLGQVLNAGGKIVGPQQFKEDVVQRMLVGTMPSGATVEIMYTTSGAIAGNLLFDGSGNAGGYNFAGRGAPQNWPVSGTWRVDDSERICTSMQITDSQKSTIVPARCEFWFKHMNTYYVSDSDENRSAKVTVRLLKQ